MKNAQCLVNGAYGIYVAQTFAETVYNTADWKGADKDDFDSVCDGPENPDYFDAWDNILGDVESKEGGVLYQGESGDVFLIYAQSAIEAIDSHCEAMREYETEHKEAGDNYAHMVAESWSQSDTDQLQKNLIGPETADMSQIPYVYSPAWKIDAGDMESDTVADIALDIFKMESGHIFSNMESDGIILASFPVGEIEIDLSGLGLDDTTLEYVADSCDAYIRNGMAYLTTDSVWFAIVSPEALQAAIQDA